MKKKKNTAKKDKSAQKSAREALRFQMLWEAKKLYPNAGSELPERIDMECSIMEEANLFPYIEETKDFVNALRGFSQGIVSVNPSPFLRNSIVVRCLGLNLIQFEADASLPVLSKDMLEESLTIDICLNLSDVIPVLEWLRANDKNVCAYEDGLMFKLNIVSIRFPIVHSLQALALEKAKNIYLDFPEDEISQQLQQEIRAYIAQMNIRHPHLLEEYEALGCFMIAFRAQFNTSVGEKISAGLKNSVLAYCFGITTALPVENEEQTKEKNVEISAQPKDCDEVIDLMKEHFHTQVIGSSNGLQVDLDSLKLEFPLTGIFRSFVISGATSLYYNIDRVLKQRVETELDCYEHWGIVGEMMLLRHFVTSVSVKCDASVGSDKTLLGHSVAAFCLGLVKESPNVEDEKDLKYFQQKERFPGEVNVYFEAGQYENIVHYAEEYFGTAQKSEKAFSFNLGKLNLQIYKEPIEIPEGISWYKLGTIRKMMSYYSKYQY